MKILPIYKELLKEGLLSEEYDKSRNILYGYHVTPIDNIDDIKNNGFNIGTGRMQGKGFYGFYDYDHAVRYLMKEPHSKRVLVKFEVMEPNRLLYLNMDIAKEVLGSGYHLKTQLDNYYSYKGGIKYAHELCKPFYKDLDMEAYLSMLNEIEVDNIEGNQRRLPLSMMPTTESDMLNICWNGNYGLEYRINNLNLLNSLGYIEIDNRKGTETYVEFDKLDSIPDTDEFKELKTIMLDYDGTVGELKRDLEQKRSLVRNNIEWDRYSNLLDNLDKLGH